MALTRKTLAEIVERQKRKARQNPGNIVRETFPKGLIVNLEYRGDRWHGQFARIGKPPALGTPEGLKWQKELGICRRFWGIPPKVMGEPVKNSYMYATNFVWSAVEQMALV
jgi:hypothetical protein